MDKITIGIGYIKMERKTETVDHFLTHYRSQGLPPFYRSRPRTTTYPREERQDGQNNYRYRSRQDGEENRDSGPFPNTLTITRLTALL